MQDTLAYICAIFYNNTFNDIDESPKKAEMSAPDTQPSTHARQTDGQVENIMPRRRRQRRHRNDKLGRNIKAKFYVNYYCQQ